MRISKATLLVLSLLILSLLSYIAYVDSAYQHEMEICELAEGNGILEPAINHCSNALHLLQPLPFYKHAELVLKLKLAGLHRQLRQLKEAETFLEELLHEPELNQYKTILTSALIEKVLIDAMQNEWQEGMANIERLATMGDTIPAEQRESLLNVMRGYRIRLAQLGNEKAARLILSLTEQLKQH